MPDESLDGVAPSRNGARPAGVRVLLAVSDPERERRLLTGLAGAGLTIAGRCLDAVTLVEEAHGDATVALVSATLHRLTPATLLAVREAGLPLILLAGAELGARYQHLALVMQSDTPPEELRAALIMAAGRGLDGAVGARRPPAAAAPRQSLAPGNSAPAADLVAQATGRVIALVGGRGSPGATTVAIALADALAARRRTVLLVDADLRAGAVAAQLDLDPRRGLGTLAHGPRGDPETWGRRLDEEIQAGPGFMVLGGIERAAQRAQVHEEVLAAALAAARRRFTDVLVDAGALMEGLTLPAGDAALRRADHVLLVAVPTLLGLWYARAARDTLVDTLGIPRDRLAVVLNRRRGRACHAAADVARAFGAPVLADVPDDPHALDRAGAEQLPLTRVRRRGAARSVRATEPPPRPAPWRAAIWRWRRT